MSGKTRFLCVFLSFLFLIVLLFLLSYCLFSIRSFLLFVCPCIRKTSPQSQGKQFAQLEASVIACHLLQKYKFTLVPRKTPITYVVSITLSVKDGLDMMVEKRQPLKKQ